MACQVRISRSSPVCLPVLSPGRRDDGPIARARVPIAPWQVAIDTAPFSLMGANTPLASSGPVATLLPAVASGGASVFNASPAFQLLDLGEIAIPALASGFGQSNVVRLWFAPGPSWIATSTLSVGGMYLLPIAGRAGVVATGISIGVNPMQFTADGINGVTLLRQQTNNTIIGEPLAGYRGVLPQVGASTSQLDLLEAGHSNSGSWGWMVRDSDAFAAASVRYRPRFAFLKGL